ncbi:MAG: DUF2892 domain-containing protein [Candidatus Latescibacteria bacterium]|jgi:hypothetical protein|nr:DUF2892 domain-containing protein [Candidatus Latescibacterota bacterium]
MQINVGRKDRVARIVIGVGVYFQSWLGAIGIVPLFTAVVRWCPAYVPFGTSTCEKEAAGN